MVGQKPDHRRRQFVVAVDEKSRLVVDHGVSVARDAGRHRGCRAGGGLREGHTPTFRTRCAGDDPGTPVGLEENLRRHAPLERAPFGCVELSEAALEVRALIPLTDDPQPGVRNLATHRRHCVEQCRKVLRRHEPPDSDNGRNGRLSARSEAGVDSGWHHVHVVGRQPEPIENVGARRLRQGHDRCAPVERRGNPPLKQLAGSGQFRREHHRPHVLMHMVQPCCAMSAGPQWGKKGDTVPDLDQGVTAAVTTEQFSSNSPRKDQIPAGVANDLVAISNGPRWRARSVRGAHDHLNAGGRPARGDGTGMQFRAAGLDVFKIAPGQHVDPADPGVGGKVPDFGRRPTPVVNGALGRLRVIVELHDRTPL